MWGHMTDYLSWGYDELLPLIVKPAEWHAARRKGLGGSDANVIAGGDEAKLLQLYQEKRGEATSEDLSDVIPVLMGTVTEPLNRYIYTKRTGRKISSVGESHTHPIRTFMRVSLDGLTTTETNALAVYEAKHVNPFNFDIDTILRKYQPQLQHAMICTAAPHAYLSVLVGTQRWECLEVPADPYYMEELIEMEAAFWECVQTGKPPVALPAPTPPKREGVLRTVDFTGNNLFAFYAAQWLETKPHASSFDIAERNLKELVDPDVGLATGHGISAKRDKAGRLRISPLN
jgi:predicted phage-related endonuclease